MPDLGGARSTVRLVIVASPSDDQGQVTDEEELGIKIVVIGGTGLIGSKSAAILRQGGDEMIATQRVGILRDLFVAA